MKHLILLLALLVVAGCGESEPEPYRVEAETNFLSSNYTGLHAVKCGDVTTAVFPAYTEARAECDRLNGAATHDGMRSIHPDSMYYDTSTGVLYLWAGDLVHFTRRWTFDPAAIYRPDGTVVYTFADSLEFAGLVAQMEEWGGP